MVRFRVQASVASSARLQRHADRSACCEVITASLARGPSFLGLCAYEKELNTMAFSKVTTEGESKQPDKVVLGEIDASQFSPAPISPDPISPDPMVAQNHRLGHEGAQADSLVPELEQQYRRKIVDAVEKISSGNVDFARQCLLGLMFDPALPTAVSLELAEALSKVDLARFSFNLCERLSEAHEDEALIAYALAVYSLMCRKPPYVSEMNLLKACELEPENARYRIALITWLLAKQRISEAVVYSAMPQQLDWNMSVCGCCLAWVSSRFKQCGNIALSNLWSSCDSLCSDTSGSACCKRFRCLGKTGRAW